MNKWITKLTNKLESDLVLNFFLFFHPQEKKRREDYWTFRFLKDSCHNSTTIPTTFADIKRMFNLRKKKIEIIVQSLLDQKLIRETTDPNRRIFYLTEKGVNTEIKDTSYDLS